MNAPTPPEPPVAPVPPPALPPIQDRASAEAAAERLMAMHRVQQEVQDRLGEQRQVVSRWTVLVAALAFGALTGSMLGALRGHAGAGALLMALLAAMLTLVVQRPR